MKETLLNEICELIVDCPHSTAYDEGKGYPLVRTPNIGRGRLIYDGMHRVCEDVYNARNARAVPQENDLIFAREATAGNVAIIQKDEKVCLGQRTVLIRPNSKLVDPNFLAYFLLAPKQQYNLLSTANGATVAHVNMPTIRNLKLELPEFSIQKRIATILSRYDTLIENYQKQIKLLEEAAQRLYKEWFVDLRFPGYEKVKVVDGVPEGWERKKLGEIIELDPKVPLAKERVKQFVPMQALSVNSMVMDQTQFSLTTSNSGSKFQNGDTLLARITPCLENGKTAYVNCIESNEGGIGSTEYIVMRSLCYSKYMVYLLARSYKFREYAIKCMSGSDGRQRVQKDKLSLYMICVPKKNLIAKFDCFAKPIFAKIKNLSSQIRNLTESRDRLLVKLMSGEVEV